MRREGPAQERLLPAARSVVLSLIDTVNFLLWLDTLPRCILDIFEGKPAEGGLLIFYSQFF